MSNRQIAAMIARRKARQAAQAKNNPSPVNPMHAACLEAAGFSEHHSY